MADAENVYLLIPSKYKCVRDKLLIDMSTVGVDLINSCVVKCDGKNKVLLNCWVMFNSACAAYHLGETKKAEFLIDYIINQFDYDCKVEENTAVDVYVGNTDIAPATFRTMSVGDIIALNGTSKRDIQESENQAFTINQTSGIHYVVVPSYLATLDSAEYGDILKTTLWSNTDNDGAYFKTNNGGIYNGVYYDVYFSYSPMGALPEDIRVTFKKL